MEVPDPEIPAPPVKRISTMLVILAVMVASTLWLRARDPEELLQQGLHLRAKSPAASERLFRRAGNSERRLSRCTARVDRVDDSSGPTRRSGKIIFGLGQNSLSQQFTVDARAGAYFGDLPKMAWESLESVPITDSARFNQCTQPSDKGISRKWEAGRISSAAPKCDSRTTG